VKPHENDIGLAIHRLVDAVRDVAVAFPTPIGLNRAQSRAMRRLGAAAYVAQAAAALNTVPRPAFSLKEANERAAELERYALQMHWVLDALLPERRT